MGKLLPSIRWKGLAAGEILLREGDSADAMYVVVSGRLRATREDDGETRIAGDISRGLTQNPIRSPSRTAVILPICGSASRAARRNSSSRPFSAGAR